MRRTGYSTTVSTAFANKRAELSPIWFGGSRILSAEDSQDEPDQLRAIRLNKLNALKQAGADPFSIERFDRTHLPAQIVDEAAPHWALRDEEREMMIVRAAGRISAIRPKGKVTF